MDTPDKTQVSVVLGTRPEVIKLGPIIEELKKRKIATSVVSTNQQPPLLELALKEFGIVPDFRCLRTSSESDLALFIADVFVQMKTHFELTRPSWVLVQGDTATALAGALSGFLAGVSVAHVEAGLRTYRLMEPFPEEGFRQIISRIASIHFSTTAEASANLESEGIRATSIHIVGNTISDSIENLQHPRSQSERSQRILVTLHRRENFGDRMRSVCDGVKKFLNSYPEMTADVILHPNPNSHEVIQQEFASTERVRLLPPLSRQEFLRLLCRADCVLTDSGGVQEEAFLLGIPLVVARLATERPEVLTGTAVLSGISADEILFALRSAVNIGLNPEQSLTASDLYGHGSASKRIVDVLLELMR